MTQFWGLSQTHWRGGRWRGGPRGRLWGSPSTPPFYVKRGWPGDDGYPLLPWQMWQASTHQDSKNRGRLATTNEDFRTEMFLRNVYEQWPLHLAVQWPATCSPPQWRSLVDNRLVATLGPQLDACGFFARPMCSTDPFVFLLWPQEAAWIRNAETEVLLPLRRRVARTQAHTDTYTQWVLAHVLFLMLLEAHRALWPAGCSGIPPQLRDLVPEVRLFRHLPENSTARLGVLDTPRG